MSDATLVARLGNEELSGQAAERQAASLQASTSGRTGCVHFPVESRFSKLCFVHPITQKMRPCLPRELVWASSKGS